MSRWDAFDEDELAIIAAGAVLAAIMELKGDTRATATVTTRPILTRCRRC
jgi:hypothetical protein